jgi:ADP-ribose pyrophosphatase YjhB (NUDIX family)
VLSLPNRRGRHRTGWHKTTAKTPPGGVLELNETVEDGLRREAREETGLDIEPIALTGVYKNMTRGIVALVFRCKPTGGSLMVSDEVAAFRWAEPSQIAELADEAYAVRVPDAMQDDHPLSVRAHDGVRLLAPDQTRNRDWPII